MLVAASVLPHPPLLVPEVSVATPDWLAELRAAVADSVQILLGTEPDLVVSIGSASPAGDWDEQAGGTMAAYGVDTTAGGPTIALPLSLTIAARLLDDAGWPGPRRYVALTNDRDAGRHADAGARIAASAARVAVLAMGDGSARRTTEAPGYFDERSTPFDAAVVAALATADARALLAMSPAEADDLWVAGLPAWQALAGALEPETTVDAAVRYDAAPRGVGYFVVDWTVGSPTL
ncbi:MAG TPA: hypothetical protein VLK34_01785 [Nocardioidaceae bacterium]|nr:hypothetical protein [Nocardioidaceae bacterium]